MEYRRIGNSGLRVSEISIGGWLTFGAGVDADNSARILRAAIDRGVNFIDLADAYARGAAEDALGRMLPGLNRSSLVISSKVFWPMSDDPNDKGLSRKHVHESIDRTLKRLRTDYLDIYFCHRHDPETAIEETIRAMDDLIRRGKILYWGTSVWPAGLLLRTHTLAREMRAAPPLAEQPMYNLMHRDIERSVMPTARRLGMGLVVWSPLAGGVLTGKYNQGPLPPGSRGATTHWLKNALAEPSLARVRKFCELAREAGMEPAHLALAWCLRRPEVASVITGATTTEQLIANLEDAGKRLPDDLARRITRLFPHPSPYQRARRLASRLRHRFRAGKRSEG